MKERAGSGSKNLISVKEAAEILNVSRVHVIRLINQGKVEATRVGRAYVVNRNSLGGIFKKITAKDKREIEQAVEKTVQEYGEVLRKLGSE